jgi:hypothetical protein
MRTFGATLPGPRRILADMRPLHFLPLLFAALTLAGCGSRTATFPGYSDPEVWNAMVTVAKNPEYDDWFVFENEVWTDRPEGRIEIHRFLRRDLVRVGSDPERQEERWKFEIAFLNTDPPTVGFSARQITVPAHLWREADRYFEDMRSILGVADLEIVETVEVEVEVIDAEPDVVELDSPPAVDLNVIDD